MRIGIVGAGELGTVYGARLLEVGEDVVFVARGDRLKELKERGINAAGSGVAVTKGLTATDEPVEAGVVELLLFCVKTYDLEEAAIHIRPMIGDETVVVPVQNGLYAPDRLVCILGPNSVVGGVAMRGIQIGELDGQITERIRRVAETLNRAGFGAEIRTDIRVALWEKYLMACGASVVAAASPVHRLQGNGRYVPRRDGGGRRDSESQRGCAGSRFGGPIHGVARQPGRPPGGPAVDAEGPGSRSSAGVGGMGRDCGSARSGGGCSYSCQQRCVWPTETVHWRGGGPPRPQQLVVGLVLPSAAGAQGRGPGPGCTAGRVGVAGGVWSAAPSAGVEDGQARQAGVRAGTAADGELPQR